MKLTKRKLFKIVSLSLIGIFFISAVSAALFIYFYPEEKLRMIINERAEKILKRKVKIGSLKYTIRGITITDVVLHDGMNESDQVIFLSESASVGFSLRALLRLEVNINKIHFKNPFLTISFSGEESNLERLMKDIGTDDTSGTKPKIDFIKLDDAEVSLVAPPQWYLKPLEGKFGFTGRIDFKDKKILFSDARITLPEKRGTLVADLELVTGADDFVLSGDVVLKNTNILWTYKWADSVSLPYTVVNGDVKNIKITSKTIEGFLKASSTVKNSENLLFADGYCKVNREKRSVFISNVKGKIQTSSFLLNELMLNFDGDLISFGVTGIDAFIAEVRPLLHFLPAEAVSRLNGKVRGNLGYKNRLFNGRLALSDFTFTTIPKVTGSVSTEIEIVNSTFKKENIQVHVLDNLCSASVASNDGAFKKIFLNLSADKFNIIKKQSGTGTAKPAEIWSTIDINLPFEVNGMLSVNEMTYDKYKFSKFNASYSIIKNDLIINRFAAHLAGGDVSGNGKMALYGSANRAALNAVFNDVKVHEIASTNEKFRNRFFGIASGRCEIGLNPADIAGTLRGKIEFSIDKGKVQNTGVQDGLGVWLSELKYKLKDLEFSKIYGNMNLNGMNFVINSFIFNSEDIKIRLSGGINQNLIVEQNLDISLEFTKRFIQDLPSPAIVLMGIDRYLQGKWYVIPFVAKGDISDSKNIKRTR